MVLKSQLRWAGHAFRMARHRLPKIALYGEFSNDYCERGAPKKRFKDSPKKNFDTCHSDHHQWSTFAADHQAWCCTVHQVVSFFEDPPLEPTSGSNVARERSKDPQQPYLTTPLTAVATAGFVCRESSQSAISMPAVDVDSLLYKYSFAKSSKEEEDIYIYIYCGN